MFLLKRLFLLVSILIMSCSFTKSASPIVKQGNVIYPFESGKMQCQSEIDPEGRIFVLLKSLNKNTTLQFVNVNSNHSRAKKEGTLVVTIMMRVEEETDLCASWTNIREVSIEIDPLPVETISLTGKQVYNSDQITIMLLNKSA